MDVNFLGVGVGLVTGGIGGWIASLIKLSSEKKLLDARQDKQNEIQLAERIERYQSLLLLSASDLQDRLWHLTQDQYTARSPVLLNKDEDKRAYPAWPMTARHYLTSTLYLAARYFAAIEMLRHEIRFLTYRQDDKTRDLREKIKLVERSFAETRLQKEADRNVSSDQPIFQMQQVFIGQSIWHRRGQMIEWLEYPQFVDHYRQELSTNEDFMALADLLRGSVSKRSGSFHHRRLTIVLNSLVDLIDFLDPQQEDGEGRFIAKEDREKVKLGTVPRASPSK